METEEEKTTEEPQQEPVVEKQKLLNSKVLLFGLPLFIVQLVAVYFVTANILLSKIQDGEEVQNEQAAKSETVENKQSVKKNVELGKYIYQVEDIIVNPAGTDGKRLLLASIGFDLPQEEQLTTLESKEVLVKDIIISALSSKSLKQLDNNAFKDTLKNEISDRLVATIPDVTINTIYFSKYIIQ